MISSPSLLQQNNRELAELRDEAAATDSSIADLVSTTSAALVTVKHSYKVIFTVLCLCNLTFILFDFILVLCNLLLILQLYTYFFGLELWLNTHLFCLLKTL